MPTPTFRKINKLGGNKKKKDNQSLSSGESELSKVYVEDELLAIREEIKNFKKEWLEIKD